MVVNSQGRDLDRVVPKNQSIGRNRDRVRIGRQLENEHAQTRRGKGRRRDCPQSARPAANAISCRSHAKSSRSSPRTCDPGTPAVGASPSCRPSAPPNTIPERGHRPASDGCRPRRRAQEQSFDSALTSDPTSMLRAVTTPSNGATMLAKAFSAFSRWTLASAAWTSASLALASLCFSSAACCDTAAELRNEFQRCAVTCASC